jgi:hypothetical protein
MLSNLLPVLRVLLNAYLLSCLRELRIYLIYDSMREFWTSRHLVSQSLGERGPRAEQPKPGASSIPDTLESFIEQNQWKYCSRFSGCKLAVVIALS